MRQAAKVRSRLSFALLASLLLMLGSGAVHAAPKPAKSPPKPQPAEEPLPPELTPERQEARIAAEVARMPSAAPGVPQVFFVGFAGYGEQGVFRKEVELARHVLGEHFGAEQRAITLVNDVHDHDSYALATFENLRDAVKLIGKRMDPSRDVLVLMLTSHGSPDAGVAITDGDVVDDDLSPRDVREILDGAGIRWRIIIASACYAGIFIKPLQNDRTLILTAADARHSSFGCADDRDLTYFGEALLKDSLPVTCSLEQAFGRARDIIESRETEEGEVHSHPQIYVGARMREKLSVLEGGSTQMVASAGGGGSGSSACRAPR